jgi:hypothetical protein
MHAEKSGHDNHHDDHADNIEDIHCAAPVEAFSSCKYPDASIGIFCAGTKVRLATADPDLPLPPAIAVIAAATAQQENHNDDE